MTTSTVRLLASSLLAASDGVPTQPAGAYDPVEQLWIGKDVLANHGCPDNSACSQYCQESGEYEGGYCQSDNSCICQ
ncbi:MAG TPA: hypothetical protein VKR06_47055 [Ktedonosporobacter sp.]|nr:hypothetical protein [Ktedonosporobacter sp.]